MAEPQTPTPLGVPPALRQGIAALRAKLVGWLLVDGAWRVLWLAVAMAAVVFVLDWFFEMDRYQRGICLGLAILAVLAAAYRSWLRPLARTPTDDALVLRVEARRPDLRERLISALEFGRLSPAQWGGMSPTLIRAVIESGADAAAGVRFADALRGRRFARNVLFLALGLGMVGLTVWWRQATDTGRVWLERCVLLRDTPWPQETEFLLQGLKDGRVVLVRGESWRQVVEISTASRQRPQAVLVDFRPAGGRPSQEMQADGEAYQVEFQNVLEPFEFRVRGRTGSAWWRNTPGRTWGQWLHEAALREARTGWTAVELVDPPETSKLELVVTPPPYAWPDPATEQQEELPPGRGPYYVLPGSSLRVAGTSTKDLDPEQCVLQFNGQTVPLRVTDRTQFEGQVPAETLAAGTYTVSLTDTIGLRSKRPTSFGLRVRPDKEPKLRARLEGISGMVTPQARVPLVGRVSDDFQVTAVRLVWLWRGDSADSLQGEGVLEIKGLNAPLPAADVAVSDALELAPLEIPADSGLSFHLAADDNDNVSGPNTGRSPEFFLRVVSEEQLRTDLLRREKEQRQEFERWLQSQEELLIETRALAADSSSAAQLNDEQRKALMGLQRKQKLISTNVRSIAQRLDEMLVEVRNNRLEEEGGPLQRRLTDLIIEPMLAVAEEDSPEAVRQLDRARRLEAQTAPRGEALAETAAVQQRIVEAMREILKHMVKAEGFQEAVNLLYEIEKSQTGVLDLTLKELQDRIRRLLEQGGAAPSPQPAPEETPQP